MAALDDVVWLAATITTWNLREDRGVCALADGTDVLVRGAFCCEFTRTPHVGQRVELQHEAGKAVVCREARD